MSQHVVLVGGGHANIQVLRRGFPPGTKVTLVSDRPVALYSGMLPGWIAGRYTQDELSIDLAALCQVTGARLWVSACTAIEIETQSLALADGRRLRFDVAAVDIGSAAAALDVPGIRERALPTRPLADLPRQIQQLLEASESERSGLAVVGGGAGGVELALALRARLGPTPAVTLVERGRRLLPGRSDRVSRRLVRACARRGVGVVVGRSVVAGDPEGLVLDDDRLIPAQRWIWATGACAPPLFERSGLSTDGTGFLRVRETLQSLDCPELFAAGDCISLESAPQTPRAGVYAVRAGPVLHHNLLAKLAGKPLRVFRPQADFLTLLDLGDGTALGTKWGLYLEGRWVSRLKARIDQGFVATYQY
jgi:selenide,water dikinase